MNRRSIHKLSVSQTTAFLILFASLLPAAEPYVLRIDFARTNGVIRPMRRLRDEGAQTNLNSGDELTPALPSPGVALITLRPALP